MTRWKREGTTVIVLMHAHNQMSRWYYALFQAASDMGMAVGFRSYRNWSDDGSTDSEWYVSSHVLERLGGLKALHDRARPIHQASHPQVF
jgi:hypothetical protein